MLALDDLIGLPGIDRDRVEIVGVSLGVPFVCVAAALDPRYRRVWAIHGAGRPCSLLEVGLRQRFRFGPARWTAAALADLILDGPGLAPERWAGRIAPRPFVMINAREDERLPPAAVEALYRSARDPKTIVWVPGGHVTGRPAPEMESLVNLILERMNAEEHR